MWPDCPSRNPGAEGETEEWRLPLPRRPLPTALCVLPPCFLLNKALGENCGKLMELADVL